MTHSYKLSRRIARLRAPLLAFAVLATAACDNTDALNPDASSPADPVDQLDNPSVEQDGGGMIETATPTLATSFVGGIPFGTFNQPNGQFGSRYNGAQRIIWPEYLNSNLAAIKSRGGKVLLDLIGSQNYVKDASGHFSFSKWKARVDRYRKVNFTSYINDGTVIGHYLIDEPNDPANWNGVMISPSTLEAMAQYSKQIWPGMVTVVRSEPTYLDNYSGSYRYLDAAWAQYVAWKGTPSSYLSKHVSAAKAKGLALIVGLNISKGTINRTALSASQVKSWGSAMLASTYPCAFLSWQYNDTYLSTSAMRDAMSYLRNKAQSRGTKSCRGS